MQMRREMVEMAEASATPGTVGCDHPADRLVEAVDRVGAATCVGFDPVVERLPEALRSDTDPARAFRHFGEGMLQAVAGVAAAVKFQSACFERFGAAGFEALAALCAAASELGIETILDGKRGDIGISAAHYAAAAGSVFGADWSTVNGYLGPEGFAPYRDGRRGVFVLVRTSNADGGRLQALRLADGRTVAEAMAEIVEACACERLGRHGLGDVGAVVGATHPQDAALLRARMPHTLLLVPGYGAQGGGVEEIRPCFLDGDRGALITASRSVIYPDQRPGETWIGAIRAAAQRFHGEIAAMRGGRGA